MNVTRHQYVVNTNLPKQNGQPVNQQDLVNIGYMAGRFGINLDGKQWEHQVPQVNQNGTFIDINSCTSDLFEYNLKTSGIKFNKLA